MCGIVGILSKDGIKYDWAIDCMKKMSNAISHRGPDDYGDWIDEDSGVAIAHRRLSIIDLTSAGHQPMESFSGRYIIVFNGEIYNHNDIRSEIAKVNYDIKWRGHSDTETIINAIDIWGVKQTLQLCVGMFALCIWDKKEKVMILARDRIGEKPLYYGMMNGYVVFSSELKAIRKFPDFQLDIDITALELYFKKNYVPQSKCIFNGFKKLKSGTFISIYKKDLKNGTIPEPEDYWDFEDICKKGKESPFKGDENEAIDELQRLLTQSIKGQMLADVPVGAFLSGGIDSSTVVAIMQEQSRNKIKTFTIGFKEKNYDESEYAKKIAQFIGTDHHELMINKYETIDVISDIMKVYDEPFADTSQIPTILVSKLARQQVTVSLSGDAGDELFGGYTHYLNAIKYWCVIKKTPYIIRHLLSNTTNALLPDKLYNNEFTARKIKAYGQKDISCFYDVMMDQCYDEKSFINYEYKYEEYKNKMKRYKDDSYNTIMAIDINDYLQNDILYKVDRAAMHSSLETRVPLLDYRIVEFSQQINESLKIRNNENKWILKKLLKRYIPEELTVKNKKGFGFPINNYLRNDLKEWADDILSNEQLSKISILRGDVIKRKWEEHKNGKKDWSVHIWMVLMFIEWYKNNK